MIATDIHLTAQVAGTALLSDTSQTSWQDGAWWQQLQPGSWRGVGFVLDSAGNTAGRRVALHEYPYRDTVWPEDLGQLPRQFQINAFLTGDDVYQQRDAMVAACEQPGPGTLVHPTMGTIECVLLRFSFADRREAGRFIEISMDFVQSSDVLYPGAAWAGQNAIGNAANGVYSASADDLARTLGSVPTVPQEAANVFGFGALATLSVSSATRPLGAVRGLAGYNGRYASGRLSVGLPLTATVQSTLAASTTLRTGVLNAVVNLNAKALAL